MAALRPKTATALRGWGALRAPSLAPWLCALLFATALHAEDEAAVEAARLETLRQEMSNEIQLQAYELLDELIYTWSQTPPFSTSTPTAIADVTVPVGFGSGLEALIENHLVDGVVRNGKTNVSLVHCPACSAMVVHSDKNGTVISRGIDQPEALLKTAAVQATHALFLDFEAEGSALVLRARITTLDPSLTIVHARTLSSATTHAALLREPSRLTSAAEARQEYLDVLHQRSRLLIPLRLSVTQFAYPEDGNSVLPLIFLESGAEMAISHTRAWTGAATIGISYFPQLHTAARIQTRVSRLLTGSATSLTHPDVYGYVGGSLTAIVGASAVTFSDDTIDAADIIATLTGQSLGFVAYPSLQAGFDVRVNNRIGAGMFIETAPTLSGAPSIGRWLDYGIAQVHAIGGEVTLWF